MRSTKRIFSAMLAAIVASTSVSVSSFAEISTDGEQTVPELSVIVDDADGVKLKYDENGMPIQMFIPEMPEEPVFDGVNRDEFTAGDDAIATWDPKWYYNKDSGYLIAAPYPGIVFPEQAWKTDSYYNTVANYSLYIGDSYIDSYSVSKWNSVTPSFKIMTTLAAADLNGKVDHSEPIELSLDVWQYDENYSSTYVAESSSSTTFDYDGCDEVTTIAPPSTAACADDYFIWEPVLGADGYIIVNGEYDETDSSITVNNTTNSYYYNSSYNGFEADESGQYCISVATIDANGDRSAFKTFTLDESTGIEWESGIAYDSATRIVSFNGYDGDYPEYTSEDEYGIRLDSDFNYYYGNYFYFAEQDSDIYAMSMDTVMLTLATDQLDNVMDGWDSAIISEDVEFTLEPYADIRVALTPNSYTTSRYYASDTYTFTWDGIGDLTALSAPTEVSDINHGVSWKAVDGAIGYIVCQKYESDSSSSFYSTTKTSYTPSSFYGGNVDYTIYAVDKNGDVSAASDTITVTESSASTGGSQAQTWKSNIAYDKTTHTVTFDSMDSGWNDYYLGFDLGMDWNWNIVWGYEDSYTVDLTTDLIGKLYSDYPIYGDVNMRLYTSSGYPSPVSEDSAVISYYGPTAVDAMNAPAVTTTVEAAYDMSNDLIVKFDWNDIAGAEGYLLKVISNNGTEVYYSDASFYTGYRTVGVDETFKVSVAYIDANGKVSKFSTPTAMKINSSKVLTLPKITKATVSGSSVTLQWEKDPNAAGYYVYTTNDSINRRATTTATSCTITDLEDDTYYFVVLPYTSNGFYASYFTYNKGTKVVIKVNPDAPANVRATENNGVVNITWDAVDGATSYRVFRADSLTGEKTLLKTRTSCNYTDTTVEAGKTYYYYVAAYNATSGKISAYSSAAYVSIPNYPSAPTGVKVVSGGGNATITWNAVDNATSYRVFRSTSLTGARSLVKVRTSTYYIDTAVDTGKTYYYWIVAYNANTGLKSGYSASTSAKIVDTFDQTPAIKTVNVTSKTVTLTWDVIPGATSYRIYRRNDDGTRRLIASQSMTEFKDTGLTKGKIYKYEIRAYSATTKALTPYSAMDYVRPMAAPTIMSGNVKGKITWDKNLFATSYRVYRAESINGPKKLLAPTTLTYYTDTTAVDGKLYYYFVAGYDNVTGTLTAFSNAKAIIINK